MARLTLGLALTLLIVSAPIARADTQGTPTEELVDLVLQMVTHPPRLCPGGGLCILNIVIDELVDPIKERVERAPDDARRMAEDLDPLR